MCSKKQTSFCFKEAKGAPAIAKEIAKGWFSQGDYNKLIHMFKACKLAYNPMQQGQSDHTTAMVNISKIL